MASAFFFFWFSNLVYNMDNNTSNCNRKFNFLMLFTVYIQECFTRAKQG